MSEALNVKNKHKYTLIGIPYLFGLICAYFIGGYPSLAVFILLGVLYFFLLIKRNIKSFSLAVIAAAFLISGLYRIAVIDKCYELDGKTAEIEGVITERHNPDNDTVMLSIDGYADGLPVKFVLFTEDIGAVPGDKVYLTASFRKFTDRRYFSEAAYNYSKGIFLRAYAKGEILSEKGITTPYMYMRRFSDYLKDRLSSILADDAGALIKAVLFGDKSGLSSELSVQIKRSGIAHLTAVSGMHLSLMAHITVAVITAFFGKRKKLAAAVSGLYIIAMMLFFGMTASVLRSGIMLLLYYGGMFIKRHAEPMNSIDKALFLILAANPCACFDAGLWLSVLGTIGVGVVAPMMQRIFVKGRFRNIKNALISTVSASLCTAPIGMLCFGGISLAAPITCLLVQPFFTVIIIVVPVALLITFLLKPLLLAAAFASEIMADIIRLIGELSQSYTETDGDTVRIFWFMLFICISMTAVMFRNPKFIIYASALPICFLLISRSITSVICRDYISLSAYSDGTDGILILRDKYGTAAFSVSDSDNAEELIYEYTCGERLYFICIGSDTDNNNEINSKDYGCKIHLPDNGDKTYLLNEYTVDVVNGEIFIDIRGLTVGITDIKNNNDCDIAIRSGYGKDFPETENFATVLYDKRFYEYKDYINACYGRADFIINKEGKTVILTD